MKIPLVDLQAEYESVRSEVDSAIAEVLKSGQYILGPQVAAFEQEVAAYVGTRFAIGVASGTDALIIALRAAGVAPGDDVIVPAFSFVASASAVALIGARPVFADVDPATFLMDTGALEAALTARTTAVLPVHLFGQPADMDPILDFARRNGLSVIEDNAQAIGAMYEGRRTGSLGDVACLSFYPGKNLGAYGDGGMITTNDERIAEVARLLRTHGWKTRYVSEILGYNSRLDEMQAAVLRVKLRHLDAWTSRRRVIAHQYSEALRGPDIQVPLEMPGRIHVFYRYVPACRLRNTVRERLQAAGIASAIYFPQPLHLLPVFASLGGRAGQFPASERACLQLLALPLHPWLSEGQIAAVCEQVKGTAGTSSPEDG